MTLLRVWASQRTSSFVSACSVTPSCPAINPGIGQTDPSCPASTKGGRERLSLRASPFKFLLFFFGFRTLWLLDECWCAACRNCSVTKRELSLVPCQSLLFLQWNGLPQDGSRSSPFERTGKGISRGNRTRQPHWIANKRLIRDWKGIEGEV
jgi:hypothetical protein